MRCVIASLLAAGLLAPFVERAAADDKNQKIEPAAVNLGRPVDFEKDIYPVLENNCIACHNVAVAEGKLNLEDAEGMLRGGKRGTAVVPKEPDKSLLYLAAARAKEPHMPPLPNQVGAEAFTPQELGLMRQWILEGAAGGSGSGPSVVQWQPLPTGLRSIYSVALSPTTRFAAAGRANQIFVYDLTTGDETARLTDPNLLAIELDGQPMYPDGAAHRDFVHSLAFSPDGSLLASGGYRVVKLWQRPENVQKFQLAAGETVTAAAVSADGQWAAVGSADKSIRLWNLETGEPGQTLAGHEGAVSGLRFSPDGAALFSGGQDKSVRVWNVAEGKETAKFETPAEINALALNEDATKIITGHADNTILVWAWPLPEQPAAEGEEGEAKEETGPQPEREIKGHGGPVTALELVTPPGTQLLSGSADGTVRVWDLNSGSQVRAMNHGGPVTAIAVRPDGQMFASASENSVAKLWVAANGQQKAELKGNLQAARRTAEVVEEEALAKQLFTLADNNVKAAEAGIKEREEAHKKATEAKAEAEKALTEADGKLKTATEKVAAAKKELEQKPDDAAVQKKVTDAEAELTKETEEQKKADDAVKSAVRTLDLAEKAVQTAKSTLETKTAEKEAAEKHQKQLEEQLAEVRKVEGEAPQPLRAIAFSADGKKLAAGGDDQIIHLWDGENGVPLETLAGHQGPVSLLTFAADNLLISGAGDKTARLWDVSPAWELVGQLGPSKDEPLDLAASPFASRILSLGFSPDGKVLATGGGDPSRSGELMLWDVEKQSLVRELEDAHSDTVLGLEFSRDGKLLLSGAADKFVKIFEVGSGKHVRSFEGHTHHVLDVSWKADGTTIASAGADNAIKVWTVETGEQQRTIANYTKEVTAIRFIGITENVVSCGGDKTVRFHRTSNGQNYRNFAGPTDFMYAAAASRDEAVVVAGGEDGVLRVWNGTNAQVRYSFEPPPSEEEAAAQASASGQEE